MKGQEILDQLDYRYRQDDMRYGMRFSIGQVIDTDGMRWDEMILDGMRFFSQMGN